MYCNFIKYFGLFRNELLPYADVIMIMKTTTAATLKYM